MKPISMSLEEWCLKTNHKDILQNFIRDNNSISASKVGKATRTKYRWKCDNPKHSPWFVSPAVVTSKCSGCSTCKNRRIEPGVNDILTLFPNICKDWDYKKNANIDIRQIKQGSQRKIWWKCIYCGKEWSQAPNRKINRHGIDVPGCTEYRRKHTKKENNI